MRWPSRRAGFALAASLLAHAALVALLARAPSAPPPHPPEPIVLEVVETPRRPAPPPAAQNLPKPKSAAPLAKVGGAHAHAAPQSAPLVAQPQRSPEPPEVASGPDVPKSDVPNRPAAPDLANAATRSADRVAESHLAVEPPKLPQKEDRSIQAPFVIDGANDRVASMLREGLGRDRVERGMIDPYFKQLGNTLAGGWKPEPKVDEKGLKGFLEEAKRGLKQGAHDYMGAWLSSAAQYGKTGGLEDPGVLDGDGRLKEKLPGGFLEQGPSQLKSTRVALVRLTQRLDGKLLNVELVQPSIDPEMDREILRELRVGEMVMPVPPSQGQGIHNPIRSLWAFQLEVSISPPVPMVSGSFDLEAFFDKKSRDEMGGLVDVRMPLSRRIRKTVSLVSVE